MGEAVNEYEEARRQMLEANKRRMEELGLMDLKDTFKRPKKPKTPSSDPVVSRRSARQEGKPKVSYRESDQITVYGLEELRSRVRRVGRAGRVGRVGRIRRVFRVGERQSARHAGKPAVDYKDSSPLDFDSDSGYESD